MTSKKELQNNLLEFIDIYENGDYENIRIKAHGLLSAEVRDLAEKAINGIEEPNPEDSQYKDIKKCDDAWCRNPEKGNKCEHWSDLSDRLIGLIINGPDCFEDLLVLFWYVHATAYEKWEDSFEYHIIGCRLHLGRTIVKRALKFESLKAKLDKYQLDLLSLFQDLSMQIHYAAYIENSMICNNAEAFIFHSEKHAQYSETMIEKMKGICSDSENPENDSNFYIRLAFRIEKYLDPVKTQHEALASIGHLVLSRRTDFKEFQALWPVKKFELENSQIKLQESGNYESASEIRAHISLLQSHHDNYDGSRLVLNQVDGKLMYGFYIEQEAELSNKFQKKDFFDSLKAYFEGIDGDWSCTRLKQVTNDPPPDILESTLGKEHFYNIMLVFNEIAIFPLPVEENNKCKSETSIGKLTPKLFHFSLGVGMLCFEILLEKSKVEEFSVIKHIASPHSGEFEYSDVVNGDVNENKVRPETLLSNIAKKIISKYFKFYEDFLSQRNQLKQQLKNKLNRKVYDKVVPITWFDKDLAWFTHFEIYAINENESDGNLLNYETLKDHYEWPGIIAYQRADRASLDDWVAVDVDKLGLHNLAQTRAHKGDVFIISENHSICYLYDDPKFIVLQYGETAKWLFLIRTLLLYCMQKSHSLTNLYNSSIDQGFFLGGTNVNERKKFLEKELFDSSEKMFEIQKYRILSISILEHVAAVGASHYADHSLLLKQSFWETGIKSMVEQLQNHLESISDIQEGFTLNIERINSHISEIRQRQIDTFLIILAIIEIVHSYDVFFERVTTENQDIRLWVGFLSFAIGVLLLLRVVFNRVSWIRYKKKWNRLKDEKRTK